jgi:large subunit ribosomal protein L4
MKSALSLFCKEDRILVIDNLDFSEIKTAKLSKALGVIGASKAVIVDTKENQNLKISAKNLANHIYLPPEGLNVYDLLKHDQLVISKDAALKIQDALISASGKGGDK